MTSANPRPARLTSAGAILRRELAARGWTQRDLAEVIGRPAQAISEIVQGSKRITAETALELAAALGTSAEVWLRLDASHWLRLAEDRQEMVAARRSRRFPVAVTRGVGETRSVVNVGADPACDRPACERRVSRPASSSRAAASRSPPRCGPRRRSGACETGRSPRAGARPRRGPGSARAAGTPHGAER